MSVDEGWRLDRSGRCTLVSALVYGQGMVLASLDAEHPGRVVIRVQDETGKAVRLVWPAEAWKGFCAEMARLDSEMAVRVEGA